MLTVGLDISITATGVVAINENEVVFSDTIKSKPSGDKPIDEIKRLKLIANTALDTIFELKGIVSLVAIEGPAFMAKNTSSLVQLSALSYMVRDQLCVNAIPFIVVAPSTLKKYVSGKGNAQKDVMIMETYKRYGHTFTDNNICDAFGLAEIAQAVLGGREKLTLTQLEVVSLLKNQL